MKFSARFLIIGIFLSNISWSESFDLATRTWSLGGDANLGIKTNFDGMTNLDLTIKPSASFVVLEKWELGLRPIFNLSIMRDVPIANRLEWGAHFFTRWHFLIRDGIYYYVGANVGGRIFDLDAQSWKASFGAENGFLVGLSKAIALDLGVPIIAHYNSSTGFGYVEIPIGYLGIKAFF